MFIQISVNTWPASLKVFTTHPRKNVYFATSSILFSITKNWWLDKYTEKANTDLYQRNIFRNLTLSLKNCCYTCSRDT